MNNGGEGVGMVTDKDDKFVDKVQRKENENELISDVEFRTNETNMISVDQMKKEITEFCYVN